jgi:hypothetical protein
MKTIILSLILFSVVNLANSQTKEECINIIETNLCEVVTNVVKITKLDDKIVVLSERDNSEYNLSINLNNSIEFSKQIEVGARISIQTKEGIKYIYVARKEESRILTNLFKICN